MGRSPIKTRARGFTLMELMFVVILVAILAMIATPSFSTARNDRLAFNYARLYQEIIHKARARASGRGAAHLVILGPGSGDNRGFARVFEALDGQTPGPNPVSSCKGPTQWDATTSYPALTTSTFSRFVEGLDLNTTDTASVNVKMDVMTLRAINRAPETTTFTPSSAQPYMALCFTPGGVTYAAGGLSPAVAITAMQASPPFNDVVEIAVVRRTAGNPVGIRRRVIVAGSTAPRLRSE